MSDKKKAINDTKSHDEIQMREKKIREKSSMWQYYAVIIAIVIVAIIWYLMR